MAPRSPRLAPSASLVTPLLGVLALLLALSGCGTSAPGAPPLPAAADLLSRSAAAMASVQTAAVDVRVDPALTMIPVRSATGKLTATGDAVGTATVAQGSAPVEFSFVITKGTLYLKGATGRYQRWPLAVVASIYDPTALLRPDRGVAALLRTATNGTTEAREDVDGVPAYRLRATLDPNLVSGVVPGLTGANNGTVWIGQASSQLLRAQVEVPNPAGGPPVPATVTLSELNAPVTVTPPS